VHVVTLVRCFVCILSRKLLINGFKIPGDGIGAEITDSVKEIFEHVNAPIEWEQYDVSGNSAAHEELFKQAVESMKRNKVGLKGMFHFAVYTAAMETRTLSDQVFSSRHWK
jgi:isocitrate/isopropylmalate dehydrogenase